MNKEEITKLMQQQFPGFQILHAEDTPNLPDEVLKMMKALEEKNNSSIINGTCIDCGVKMPNYDKIEIDVDWNPEKGWRHFEKDGEVVCWQCPDCDKKEETETMVN